MYQVKLSFYINIWKICSEKDEEFTKKHEGLLAPLKSLETESHMIKTRLISKIGGEEISEEEIQTFKLEIKALLLLSMHEKTKIIKYLLEDITDFLRSLTIPSKFGGSEDTLRVLAMLRWKVKGELWQFTTLRKSILVLERTIKEKNCLCLR